MVRLRFVRFDTVESTNDIALQMARDGAEEGTVVVARRQLRGRGRQGRAWLDEPGSCVLMSIISNFEGMSVHARQLSFVAGLAVARCLESDYNLNEIALKWPNDVLVRDKKIAGILVETLQRPGDCAAVVGIGINVLQENFSPEISELATSVAIEGGNHASIERISESTASHFFALRDELLSGGFEEILSQWRKYIWGLGKQAEVTGEGRTVTGEIAGVDADGSLLIAGALGNLEKIRSAEVIRVSTN